MARSLHNCLLRSEQGQSTVELGLAFPVLLLILMGILDFGRAYFAYVTITNAAREGARYGIVNPTDNTGITNRVYQELNGAGVGVNSVSVACSPNSCANAHNGQEITVTVSSDFNLLTTGILPFGNTIALSNSATMAILNGLP